MRLYISPENKKIVIRFEDVKYFAEQLKAFVDTYFNNILIFDSNEIKILDELDKIADALLEKRFDEVFERNVEIDYGDKVFIELPF